MILFFENQRQIVYFFRVAVVGREHKEYVVKMRSASGVVHYFTCLFYLLLGHEIAIIYPRQNAIASLAVRIKKVFFIEDGLNSLRTKKIDRDILFSRWFGERFRAMNYGYEYNSLQLEYFREAFGFEAKLNSTFWVRPSIVIILNNKPINEIVDTLGCFVEFMSPNCEIFVFNHPGSDKMSVKSALIKFFDFNCGIEQEKIFFPQIDKLYCHIDSSRYVFSFRSAVLLDFWLTCTPTQKKRFAYKIYGIM